MDLIINLKGSIPNFTKNWECSHELDHSDIGQMNLYLNYFKENEKVNDENDPVGLILCAKKDEVFAKYVLGNLNNKIFASKYKLALPTEKELARKISALHLLEDKNEVLNRNRKHLNHVTCC